MKEELRRMECGMEPRIGGRSRPCGMATRKIACALSRTCSQSPEPRRSTPARTFEDLVVWKKAHELVLAVYGLTEKFPAKEMYGLSSQFRRAAVSVPANIAEGFKKRGKADKARFLNIAQGSLAECRYYCILSRDLGFADTAACMSQLEVVSKILDSYCSAVLGVQAVVRESEVLYEFQS